MKKVAVICLVATVLMVLSPVVSEAKIDNREAGGIPAFFVGCCLGLRTGLEWNDGAELHWREWTPLIPYVGLIFSVWNGIDCAGGATPHEWAEMNGANWY